MFGICNLAIVPVRAEASDRSEIVTQLLFGEHIEILERKNQWARIRIQFDDYEGWVDSKQYQVISKEQFDDDTDDLISYQLMNTGGQVHLLFNMEERRVNLLNDYTVTPGGQISRNPTLKNLDKGYEFMAKYGKQVSAHQMIVPCLYRNTVCFAKIEFN
jgi:uncharacterized protein YgiM (DUF1202 family)